MDGLEDVCLPDDYRNLLEVRLYSIRLKPVDDRWRDAIIVNKSEWSLPSTVDTVQGSTMCTEERIGKREDDANNLQTTPSKPARD